MRSKDSETSNFKTVSTYLNFLWLLMSPLETGTTHVTYLLRCPYCQTFYSRESSFPFFGFFFLLLFFVKKTIRVKHSLSAVSTGQRIFYEFDLRGLSFPS